MKSRLIEINEWIVAGEISRAKRALLELSHSKVSGIDQAIELASLYRRVDWNSRGLNVLSPFVIGRGRLLPQANAGAKIEYADCLKNLGLLNEARKILLSDEIKKVPRARFILGLSYLHDYELKKAEEELSDLFHHTPADLSPYQKQIIGVNLLMAMLRDLETRSRHEQFESVFNQVQSECQSQNYQLLLRHLLVINFQFKVLGKTIKKADLIEKIKFKNLPDFSRKTAELYWCLAGFMLGEISEKQFTKEIRDLRSECVDLRLFEVMREIDYHRARLTKKNQMLQNVYLHTIRQSYRNKIVLLSVKIKKNINERVLQNILNSRAEEIINFDLVLLKEEPLLVRLLIMLAQEQYMPLSIHFLWNALMPERHFIEPSSRQSIHQLVKRLRHFLILKGIPLEISFDQTGYRLRSAPKIKVRLVWPESWVVDSIQSLNYLNFIETIQKNFNKPSQFKLREVMSLFPGVSRRTIQFFMAKALSEAKLEKQGKNKGASYRWVTVKSKTNSELIRSLSGSRARSEPS